MELHKQQTTESTATLHHNDSVENVDAEPEKKSIIGKIKSILNLITIEPVLILYLVSTSLAGGAVANMPFEMACRVDFGLNDTICSNITVGQTYTSVKIAKSYALTVQISTGIMAFLALCFATFSDRYKVRKPFFVLPVLGEVFSAIGVLLCAIFISQWSVQIYFLMAIIVPSCFGGAHTLILSMFSYISDISTEEERTSRIGFIELVILVISPVTTAISGIFFELTGYYVVFGTCLFLYLCSMLYGLKYIKEAKKPAKRDKNVCLDVFNVKAVIVDMFKVLFRKRLGYKRMLLILTYICYILIKGPISGEGIYYGLYAIEEFSWNVTTKQYYVAFDQVVHVFGMFLAVTLLTKKLKLNDILIAIIACVFKIIVGFWYAFGHNEIMFWTGPLIGVFSGLYVIALRSLVTKLVDTSEVAKAQALFAICEALCPIMYSYMFAAFYAKTHAVFHGAVFMLSAVLTTPPLLILLVMYIMHKNSINTDNPEPEQEKEKYNDIEIDKL